MSKEEKFDVVRFDINAVTALAIRLDRDDAEQYALDCSEKNPRGMYAVATQKDFVSFYKAGKKAE
jgi:hypothetical protein